MTSCANQFNQVYKSDNYNFKYEYAKECFATGKYSRAVTLLQELVTLKKGSTEAEECLYMLAMAEYGLRDYETASEYFKKYYQTYPKGIYAENAKYYVGESLYKNAPEPRLDQSLTVSAIAAFQEYLDLYPDAKLKKQATNRLFALQDLLVEKEYTSRSSGSETRYLKSSALIFTDLRLSPEATRSTWKARRTTFRNSTRNSPSWLTGECTR